MNILLFVLSLSVAQADTFHYTMPLNICSEHGTYEQTGDGFLIIQEERAIPEFEAIPELRIVNSTWSNLSCYIQDSQVRAVASFAPEDYPILQVPTEAT